MQQVTCIGAVRWNILQKSYLFQILGSHGECNGVTDRLVEAVVGAILEQRRLLFIGTLIEVVTKLMVHGHKIFTLHFKTGLEPKIILAINVPGAGMANHIAVPGLDE